MNSPERLPSSLSVFGTLDRSETIPMSFSSRCPRKVRTIANHLCLGARTIDGNDQNGGAVLLYYDGDGFTDVRELAQRLCQKGLALRVLTRKNQHVEKIRGSSQGEADLITRSPPLRNLYKAVSALRSSRSRRAMSLADCTLSRVLFSADHVDASVLDKNGIKPGDWTNAIKKLLLSGHKEVEGEDLNDWCLRMRNQIEVVLISNGWTKEKLGYRLPNRPTESKIKGKPVWKKDLVGTEGAQHFECKTIHGAKGETHKNTLLFVPNDREDHCPSLLWWDADSEERRVAFVAATRPEQAFFLCVHTSTLARLKEKRSDFISAFDDPIPINRYGLGKLNEEE